MRFEKSRQLHSELASCREPTPTHEGKHQSLEDALKDWREKAKAGGSSPDAVFYVRSLELFEELTERYGTSHGDFANSILTDCNKLYR